MSKAKNDFKETERRVKLYYRNKKAIEKLKNKSNRLDVQIGDVLKEMRELKRFKAEVYSNMGIDYSKELIQTSSNSENAVEKEIYKYIEDLRRKCILNKKRMLKTNDRIREFEYINQDIEFSINELTEEEKRFLELKYSENKSIEFIARNLFTGARSTTYRKREEIIKKLSKLI